MAPTKPEKTMSSRLLTMKFMQRAAASSPTAPSDPSTPPPAKRQRLSSNTRSPHAVSSPGTPASNSDLENIQAALAAEELKRTQALERHVTDASETRWVLDYATPQSNGARADGPKVVSAGYAVIDAEAGLDEEDGEAQTGRRRFGMKARVQEDTPKRGEDDEESSEEDEETPDEDEDPTARLIREERIEQARKKRKAMKEARESELKRMASARRGKGVNLNKITSISGGGGLSGGRGGGDSRECHECGKKGHIRRDCPSKGKRRGSTDY